MIRNVDAKYIKYFAGAFGNQNNNIKHALSCICGGGFSASAGDVSARRTNSVAYGTENIQLDGLITTNNKL